MTENRAKDRKIDDFTLELASKAPTPGGGGASALAGALAASLASMVTELTIGKKKYAAFENDLLRIRERAEELRRELLEAVDLDAEAFEPLSRAYSIPKDDPGRDAVMEPALKNACEPPLRIMRLSAEVVELAAELSEKGSALAISDVGVAAALARSAILGASLNVYINIKPMKDSAAAERLRAETGELIEKYVPMAEDVFCLVLSRL